MYGKLSSRGPAIGLKEDTMTAPIDPTHPKAFEGDTIQRRPETDDVGGHATRVEGVTDENIVMEVTDDVTGDDGDVDGHVSRGRA